MQPHTYISCSRSVTAAPLGLVFLESLTTPATRPQDEAAPGFPTTYHELTAFYHAKYDAGIQEGRYEPFVYPWGTLGAAVVVMYLLIPHRNSPLLRRARFLAFMWIAGFAAYTIRYCRSRNMESAFSTGIISAWSVLWAATILVVNDAQLDFQRIERLEGVHGSGRKVEQNGTLAEIKEHTKE